MLALASVRTWSNQETDMILSAFTGAWRPACVNLTCAGDNRPAVHQACVPGLLVKGAKARFHNGGLQEDKRTGIKGATGEMRWALHPKKTPNCAGSMTIHVSGLAQFRFSLHSSIAPILCLAAPMKAKTGAVVSTVSSESAVRDPQCAKGGRRSDRRQ